MKKLFILFIMQLLIISTVAFATEVFNENLIDVTSISPTTAIVNETDGKFQLLDDLENRRLYSIFGFKQEEVMVQDLSEKNYYVNKLGVVSWDDGATIDTISFGRVIGGCSIDFDELDLQILANTLKDNLDLVIKIEKIYYVEMMCKGITIAYVQIEDNRIVDFIDPGLFEAESIQNIMSSYTTLEPQLYLLKYNAYVKGFYDSINNKIIKYTDFNNDYTQLIETEVIQTLEEADAEYILDFPRIDYEAIEEQKRLEKEAIDAQNLKNNIICYSIVGGLSIIILVIIIIAFIKFKNLEE